MKINCFRAFFDDFRSFSSIFRRWTSLCRENYRYLVRRQVQSTVRFGCGRTYFAITNQTPCINEKLKLLLQNAKSTAYQNEWRAEKESQSEWKRWTLPHSQNKTLEISLKMSDATKQFLFLQKYLNSARKELKDSKRGDQEKPGKSKDAETEDDLLTKWVKSPKC